MGNSAFSLCCDRNSKNYASSYYGENSDINTANTVISLVKYYLVKLKSSFRTKIKIKLTH
jgi:hypothetical protein